MHLNKVLLLIGLLALSLHKAYSYDDYDEIFKRDDDDIGTEEQSDKQKELDTSITNNFHNLNSNLSAQMIFLVQQEKKLTNDINEMSKQIKLKSKERRLEKDLTRKSEIEDEIVYLENDRDTLIANKKVVTRTRKNIQKKKRKLTSLEDSQLKKFIKI
jgi:hypothetical protein